jgi:hypothetical protein
MLQDDLHKLNSAYAEEKQFFKNELAKLQKRKVKYFTDAWNFIDLATYILLFTLLVVHLIDIFYHTNKFALWVAR